MAVREVVSVSRVFERLLMKTPRSVETSSINSYVGNKTAYFNTHYSMFMILLIPALATIGVTKPIFLDSGSPRGGRGVRACTMLS